MWVATTQQGKGTCWVPWEHVGTLAWNGLQGKLPGGAGAVPEAVLKLATLRSRDNQVRLKRHQALKEEKVLGTASVSWYS